MNNNISITFFRDMDVFIIVFKILLMVTSSMMILSKSTVHSLLFLVLTFALTSCIFLVLKAEFMAMLFLVVYLGAIIVLFLFVVMMINIRIISISERMITYVPITFFIISIFSMELFFLLSNFFGIKKPYSFFNNNWRSSDLISLPENMIWFKFFKKIVDEQNFDLYENYFNNVSAETNLHYIAVNLYLEHFLAFILASLILLIGMLGAIVLTLKHIGINVVNNITNHSLNKNELKRQQDLYEQNLSSIINSIKKKK